MSTITLPSADHRLLARETGKDGSNFTKGKEDERKQNV